MRLLLARGYKWCSIVAVVCFTSACTTHRISNQLDMAYEHYNNGDCVATLHSLSRVDRLIRARRYLQPEVSFLRGLCLERQGYLMDAVETYRYIVKLYPESEYAFRARARLKVLGGAQNPLK
ncbi:hypothetical protein [Zooshikella sp. RANM57]|uniref:hypothetical protein n=1 Tax=Zooshikella sp. RANM57 TaxID=3425863 RepID=UPI003D6DC20E